MREERAPQSVSGAEQRQQPDAEAASLSADDVVVEDAVDFP